MLSYTAVFLFYIDVSMIERHRSIYIAFRISSLAVENFLQYLCLRFLFHVGSFSRMGLSVNREHILE